MTQTFEESVLQILQGTDADRVNFRLFGVVSATHLFREIADKILEGSTVAKARGLVHCRPSHLRRQNVQKWNGYLILIKLVKCPKPSHFTFRDTLKWDDLNFP
ncbi:MAG: hypothetical protein ACRD6X_03575 [Pyrinomonadaceae bacterium]